jgi:type II secretory pathway pseudopilin PulG
MEATLLQRSSGQRVHLRVVGSTLVELLVVIGIIATLAAILLPAMVRGRELSIRVQCQSNLRQIVGACLAYAAENHTYLPSPNWAANDSVYKGPGWLYLPGQTFTPDTVQTGVIWPWLRSESIYKCRLDTGPYPAGSTHIMTSYMMNGAVCGYGYAGAIPSFKVQRFLPDAILIWEADGSSLTGAKFNDGAEYPNEGTTTRHNGGSCVGVVDGHVDWYTAALYKHALSQTPGPLWCNPASPTGQMSITVVPATQTTR